MSRVAFITGIGGQDGSFLADWLHSQGYEVHGLTRRPASGMATTPVPSHDRAGNRSAQLHYGDLGDFSALSHTIREIGPDEIYNLGALSQVAASFRAPEHTADVDALGTLRLLEAIRLNGLRARTRFYQASTAELYGLAGHAPQTEATPFHPRSPYAVAKLYAHWITINYREAYDMFACNGLLFNHDSPRRGVEFVTRKITRGMARIARGLQDRLQLGNMDAKRDWGHAKDYVRMQWLMLQQEIPQDYVIASGKQYSVRDFVTWTAEELGITLEFRGAGIEETAVAAHVVGDASDFVRVGDLIVEVNPQFFRPSDVVSLLGDPTKAFEDLGWKPEYSAREMCAEMVAADLKMAQAEAEADQSLGDAENA